MTIMIVYGNITRMKFSGNNYAFIDSQNLNLSILGQGWKLDFTRFRRYLEDKYSITKAILFMGHIAKYEPMYAKLKEAGFEIVFKPIVEHEGIVKGNVDAELVLHAAAVEFDNYDKALVVTGDGDFRCLIEYLKKHDRLLKLMVPNYYKYSSLLRVFIKDTVFMNNLRKKLSI
ncbi:NYN domain-containing protein [Patescibacteria group bacterium]|nr:NYN domain-containing protein [Patescibacteria group bacterium]